jgi:peptidyl-prolyl cis-trans isomerase C
MKRNIGKKRKREYSLVMVTSIFAIICFLSFPNYIMAAKRNAETGEKKIVARVNGQPIYEDALKHFIKKDLRKFKKFSMKRDTAELEKRLQRKALDKVIVQELINQESRKIEIKDIDEKIKGKIEELKKKYKSDEEFENFLKTKGRTEKDIKESITNKVRQEEYLERVGIRNPEVPEDEIKKYYEKTKEGFKRKEMVNVSHILIMVKEDAPSEEKEQARAKAERIRQEILEGKDFAKMANKYSEDANAPRGGDLGYIERKYMPPEFDRVAFALKKDTISEVVKTKHGFHIIKVMDRKPAGIVPYEEIRDFIMKYLQEQLTKERLSSHVRELESKAKIEVFLKE